VSVAHTPVQKACQKITVNAVSVIIIMLPAIIIVFFWLDIFPPPEILTPIK